MKSSPLVHSCWPPSACLSDVFHGKRSAVYPSFTKLPTLMLNVVRFYILRVKNNMIFAMFHDVPNIYLTQPQENNQNQNVLAAKRFGLQQGWTILTKYFCVVLFQQLQCFEPTISQVSAKRIRVTFQDLRRLKRFGKSRRRNMDAGPAYNVQLTCFAQIGLDLNAERDRRIKSAIFFVSISILLELFIRLGAVVQLKQRSNCRLLMCQMMSYWHPQM